MTAAKVLELNGDTRDSPLMEAVRRFHALSSSRGLPYCVIGGLAVVRNGYPRTTITVDILTFKEDWRKLLPLEGPISSESLDSCVDKQTGVRIDILFADGDWEIPIKMPDPRKAGEFDKEVIQDYVPAVRKHCMKAFDAAVRASKRTDRYRGGRQR